MKATKVIFKQIALKMLQQFLRAQQELEPFSKEMLKPIISLAIALHCFARLRYI